MPITLFCPKLNRELPLLSDEEYRPIAVALDQGVRAIQAYRTKHGCSLAEAKRRWMDESLGYYYRLTGFRLSDPEHLRWVRLSAYGRPCPQCRTLLRTPLAKQCVECGFRLPEGEVAGPATLSKGG